jgi:hypothetical protein
MSDDAAPASPKKPQKYTWMGHDLFQLCSAYAIRVDVDKLCLRPLSKLSEVYIAFVALKRLDI